MTGVWTSDEINYLFENYKTETTRSIAEKFGKTYDQVKCKRYELELYKMKLVRWTKEQTDYLINNYQQIGDKEMAQKMNVIFPSKKWTHKHIEKKRYHLNLKRTEEQRKRIKSRNKKRGAWKTGKTWKTRGITKIGEIRKWNLENRSYLFIKTESGFEFYSRYLYKKTFGEIPEGMIVTFKDGNQLNVVPENLILISRKENVIRNKTKSLQYPKDLKNVIHLLNKLNKKIKNYEK